MNLAFQPSRQPGRYRRATTTSLVSAWLLAWLLGAQPGLVLGAEYFSAQVFIFNHTPAGELNTDYCARAGVVDTARNSSQVLAYANGGGAHDCAGTVNQVPAGWLATKAVGFRDGQYCAGSSYYYNTSPASNWMLWITLCSNPSGTQLFKTAAYSRAYNGEDGYWNLGNYPISPNAPY
jgi:hypothetical protein